MKVTFLSPIGRMYASFRVNDYLLVIAEFIRLPTTVLPALALFAEKPEAQASGAARYNHKLFLIGLYDSLAKDRGASSPSVTSH